MGEPVAPEADTATVDMAEEAAVVAPVVMRDPEEGRDFRVEGNDISGYVGVDPEYMTYASDTEKPINTAEEQWDLGLLDHLEGNMDEDVKEPEVKETEGDETKTDDTKTDDTQVPPAVTEPPATFNAPVTVPGVNTPIL